MAQTEPCYFKHQNYFLEFGKVTCKGISVLWPKRLKIVTTEPIDQESLIQKKKWSFQACGLKFLLLQQYIPETKDPLQTLSHLKGTFEEIARLKYDERITHKAEYEKRHIDTLDTSVKWQRPGSEMVSQGPLILNKT